MAKKKKEINQQENSPPQASGKGGPQDELQLSSQKEINATLDMIIRKLEFADIGNGGDNGDFPEPPNGNGDNGDENEDNGNGEEPPELPEPGLPKTGPTDFFLTCVDLLIFELDEDVIEKLIFCTIVSMSLSDFLTGFKTDLNFSDPTLQKLERQLDEKVSNTYNQFLVQIMTGVQTAKSKRDYLKTLLQTYHTYLDRGENLADLLALNVQAAFDGAETQAEKSQELQRQLDRNVKISALNFFQETFAGKLVEFQEMVNLKVTSIKADLIFLSKEILKFTAADAGILRLAEALNLVTQSRFAEDDEFDEVFDAVEEVADTIEELAEIYQDRLKVLRTLLPFSFSRRVFEVVDDLLDDDIEIDT